MPDKSERLIPCTVVIKNRAGENPKPKYWADVSAAPGTSGLPTNRFSVSDVLFPAGSLDDYVEELRRDNGGSIPGPLNIELSEECFEPEKSDGDRTARRRYNRLLDGLDAILRSNRETDAEKET
jgi:FAD/FMN-containing dehydrogenase